MSGYLLAFLLGALPFVWLFWRERRRAVALEEQARLVEREKLVVVEFMHEMGQALAEGLSREALFQRIAHAAAVSSGALSACVFEMTGDGLLKGAAVEGLFPPHRALPRPAQAKRATRSKFIEQALKAETFRVGDGIVGGVAKSGQAELVEDGRNDPRIGPRDDPALEIRSAIYAPIVFRDRLMGVLSVANTASGNPFSQTDFSLVQSIAEQAGMALSGSELVQLQIERHQINVDLSLARNIQMMLLPRSLPACPDIDIDARYVSAQEVGGDLYDAIDLGNGRVGLAVADVSGKGISGSLIMAICRTHLRHYARAGASPVEALKAVNRSMVPEMRQGMYITVLYAIVDPARETIVFARAGHERPLYCRAAPQPDAPAVEPIATEGMPVGLVEAKLFDEAIEERSLPFRRGDLFVAYTDGLTETRNADGEEFSSWRLAQAVATLGDGSAAELNEGVLEKLRRFSGGSRFADDLTLLAVKRQ